MALQGTLDTFALPDVLRLLAATKKSGRLRITGSRGTGSVWVQAGEAVAVEATHAPHAVEPGDALFELLRFEEGAFTFDAEATHAAPRSPIDIELLLADAEALLEEWRAIELVVPSMDAWVTLRRTLPAGELTLGQELWTSVVAVGSGATVRRVAEELCLAELPVSRAMRELVEAGIAELAPTAPAGAEASSAPVAAPVAERPLLVSDTDADEAVEAVEPPAPRGPRARRAKPITAEPAEPERFVPLELPGHVTGSYDAAPEEPEAVEVDDLAAAFPGLANRLVEPAGGTDGADAEDEADLARQLATLSPRAAEAVRAAAVADTDEEREAALSEVDGEDEPLNRGLLLKFLSSVKS